MNKLEQKRAERKQRILFEAKKLFLERGISDGLMSEIAMRSGISRQRLYVYYNNLDEILSDLVADVVAHSYLARIADAPDCDSPDNIIRYSILSFKNLSEEVHDDLLFLTLYSVYATTNNKKGKAYAPFPLFEKQIRAGQESGLFRRDKPLEELTAVLSHILAGYTFYCETLSREGRDQMLSDELLSRLADMVISYLKND